MRLYNFKTSNNSIVNYYFSEKKQVILTNLISEKMEEYRPSNSLFVVLKELNSYLVKKVTYINKNGGVFKEESYLNNAYNFIISNINNSIVKLANNDVLNGTNVPVKAQNTPKKATVKAVKNNNNIVTNTQPKQAKKETPVKEETKEQVNSNAIVEKETQKQAQVKTLDKNFCLEVVNKISDFFKEFNTDATKSNRFINTLMLKAKEGLNSAKTFTKSYFYAMDYPQAEGISYKLDSYEFEEIVNNLATIQSDKHINKRLFIYFGPAGTGKTTQAIKDYPLSSVINCNSDMMAQDLFETFEFKDGKPDFKKSEFVKAMEEGKPIILDEINLLRLDALRALQTITDNKETFNYKGQNINIKEGFKIIGTMNLTVNGRVFSLPEPLVDRCADIKEFTISNEELVERAF